MIMLNYHTNKLWLFITVLMLFSCSKLVEIPDPKNTLSTDKVFNNEAQATSAVAGVLSQMINQSSYTSFSSGLTSILASASADELNVISTANENNFHKNALTANDNLGNAIWNSAYQTIYGANSIIEGIAASKSVLLGARLRKELTAEAQFLRAFSYFYLVNTYGDVPLLLTTDLAQNTNKSKTAVATIYQQIINDLKAAADGLPSDYSILSGERVRNRPIKWAAKAFLARVYLYTGDYVNAVKEATDVIAQTGIYELEKTDLNNVFLKNSSEAIWQLQQNSEVSFTGNSVPESATFMPTPLHTGKLGVGLSANLLKAFDPGDKRKQNWVDSTQYPSGNGNELVTVRFIYKYKTGLHNMQIGGIPTEYYMVLRFAELYLIRAEALTMSGQIGAGIDDINILRQRANVTLLPTSLSKEQALAAIAKERQVELFGEWGHRWFDLKRTGKAEEVLSAIPAKQPWRGNYQLLYPVPRIELERNHFLTQNPGY